MPTNPTSRTPLLCLPGMRRADAPGLGRTNQQVRRNVPRLRRLLTPKISRGRQPTEALMIIEEFHSEEMQAFAARGPADEGSLRFPLDARSLPISGKERGTQNLNCYSPR